MDITMAFPNHPLTIEEHIGVVLIRTKEDNLLSFVFPGSKAFWGDEPHNQGSL